MKNTIILLCIFILSLSCSKNEDLPLCPEEIDLGAIYPTENSTNIFPYSTENEVVFYKDETGEEYKFNFTRNEIFNFTSVRNENCCESSEENISYSFLSNNHIVEIFSDSLLTGFKLTLIPNFYHYCPGGVQLWDFLRIKYYDPNSINSEISEWKGWFDIITDERTRTAPINFLFYEFQQEIILNGVEFQEVFINNYANDAFVSELYFSFENGVIGFKISDKLFVFDRIE